MSHRRLAVVVASTIALVVPVALSSHQVGLSGSSRSSATDVQTARGVIFGQVVEAESGDPVPMAIVNINLPAARGAANPTSRAGGPPQPPGPSEARRVYTNSDGRFVLRDLPSGSYFVTVTAAGYQAGRSGQARMHGPARAIQITEADPFETVTIRLWKNAVITGIVRDETGAPAVDVFVRAVARRTNRIMPAGQLQTTTDDRGAYRLANLPPDEYLLAVPGVVTNVPATVLDEYWASLRSGDAGASIVRRDLSASGLSLPSNGGVRVGDQILQVINGRGGALSPLIFVPDGTVLGYPTLFYPASAGPSAAVPIALRSGEVRNGVDLQLRLARMSQVSGVVEGPEGPVANAVVRLTAPDVVAAGLDQSFDTAVTSTNAAGRFTLLGVPPGQYQLEALRMPASVQTGRGAVETFSVGTAVVSLSHAGGASAPSAAPTLWARSAVSVRDDGLDDLRLTLREGLRVSGRLAFDGSTAPPPAARLAAVSIGLAPVGSRQLRPTSTRSDAQGRFTTGQHVPGIYRFTHASPGAPWTLASVRAGSRDLLVEGVRLETADLTDVVVTFTDRDTEIAGSVQDGGRPADEATVFVFPAEFERWMAGGRQPLKSRTVSAESGSVFRLTGLPIGDYLVIAFAPERAPDLEDDDVVRRLAGRATRLALAAGERKSVALTTVAGDQR